MNSYDIMTIALCDLFCYTLKTDKHYYHDGKKYDYIKSTSTKSLCEFVLTLSIQKTLKLSIDVYLQDLNVGTRDIYITNH